MTRSQRIAIWVLTLIGLLAAWKLFGQGFGNFRSDQPFLARNYPIGSTFDGTLESIAGIKHHWKANTNVSVDTNLSPQVVTNWTDIVSGSKFGHGTTVANSPTNGGASGIAFDGFNVPAWITNDAPAISNCTVVLVARPTRLNDYPINPLLSISGSDTTFLWANKSQSTNVYVNVGLFSGQVGPPLQPSALFCISLVMDAAQGRATSYWNGVFFTNHADVEIQNFVNTFRTIGRNAGGGYYSGYICDLALYTNFISGVQASNIWYYSTNTYGL